MAEQLRGPFEKFVDSPYYSVYFFKKWVERYKKCVACQGRYFKKETVTAPLQSSDSEATNISNGPRIVNEIGIWEDQESNGLRLVQAYSVTESS
jgi:hypothetical protein